MRRLMDHKIYRKQKAVNVGRPSRVEMDESKGDKMQMSKGGFLTPGWVACDRHSVHVRVDDVQRYSSAA